MADKIEETVKLLIEEGRRKGFLTYPEMSKLLEDQFLPPDRMDSVFVALEDAGIDVVDEADDARTVLVDKDDVDDNKSVGTRTPAVSNEEELPAEPVFPRSVLPEKIDDPVRMYLTQMGEIPLLTRDQEIFLAKTIEITRKRFRKKCHGLRPDA